MTTYYPVPQNTISIGEFQGNDILHPKHQCSKCGHAISPYFAKMTGICSFCMKGHNEFEYIDRIFTATIYVYEFRDHKLTNAIDDVKTGEYTEEMAEILQWG